MLISIRAPESVGCEEAVLQDATGGVPGQAQLSVSGPGHFPQGPSRHSDKDEQPPASKVSKVHSVTCTHSVVSMGYVVYIVRSLGVFPPICTPLILTQT